MKPPDEPDSRKAGEIPQCTFKPLLGKKFHPVFLGVAFLGLVQGIKLQPLARAKMTYGLEGEGGCVDRLHAEWGAADEFNRDVATRRRRDQSFVVNMPAGEAAHQPARMSGGNDPNNIHE